MTPRSEAKARTARRLALVLCATMLSWVALQWLGARLGWDARWAFLFDVAALAAFGWVLVVTVGLWRARKDG